MKFIITLLKEKISGKDEILANNFNKSYLVSERINK